MIENPLGDASCLHKNDNIILRVICFIEYSTYPSQHTVQLNKLNRLTLIVKIYLFLPYNTCFDCEFAGNLNEQQKKIKT